MTAKACPACSENNNPSFTSCWRCGVDLETGKGFTAVEEYRYFYVSPLRMVILDTLTYGLFMTYWLYRNWALVKRQERRNISPLARAIFSGIFIFSLFENIQRSVESKGHTHRAAAETMAVLWLIFRIGGALAITYFARNYYYSYISMGWGVLCMAFIFPVLGMIKKLNEENGYNVKDDAKLTIGQILLVLFGQVLWVSPYLQGPPAKGTALKPAAATVEVNDAPIAQNSGQKKTETLPA